MGSVIQNVSNRQKLSNYWRKLLLEHLELSWNGDPDTANDAMTELSRLLGMSRSQLHPQYRYDLQGKLHREQKLFEHSDEFVAHVEELINAN
jgi:hypothetical protein